MTDIELMDGVKTGFKKWMTLDEIYAYVITERTRVPSKAPVLYAIAFAASVGYMKIEAHITQIKRILNEDGSLRDLEIFFVNDNVSEPIMVLGSIFQPNTFVKFCRLFDNYQERDKAYSNIEYLSELAQDYHETGLKNMRKRFGM